MLDLAGKSADAQDGRFSRFSLISWWEQKRLSQARVLMIGAGALGNEIIKNLALAGAGNLLIADMDRVENSNLSRSVLFRPQDNGTFKASVACASARNIYPGIQAQPFCGNVVHDLGLGVYLWADVIIGGLDNREARVAINSGASFARKCWIDGAIEALDGVARVFNPQEGACYECTMSQIDWKIIESRRSCALLTREEMAAGRVPTTPTTSSIIGGIQAQEAIKLLHGLPAMQGEGIRYSGLQGEFSRVSYPRKPDCFGHETYESLTFTGMSSLSTTVGEMLDMARAELGQEAVVGLSRDLVQGFRCPHCGQHRELFRALGRLTEQEARCERCGTLCAPDLLTTLGLSEDLDKYTLHELGMPLYDVVTARNASATRSYVLDGDAPLVLGDLERLP